MLVAGLAGPLLALKQMAPIEKVYTPPLKHRSLESRSPGGITKICFPRFGYFWIFFRPGSGGERFLGHFSYPAHLTGGRGTQIGPNLSHFWVFDPPLKSRSPLKVDHHGPLKVDHHGGPCRIRSTFKGLDEFTPLPDPSPPVISAPES